MSRLIAALLTIGVGHMPPQAGGPAARNDEDAIKQVIATTTEAFSRHDAKAWVKFCTPDARLVTVRGESMNGVREIEKGLTTVTNQLSGLVNPEGQTLPSHQELSIRVLVKDQGAWRITAFHNTIVQK